MKKIFKKIIATILIALGAIILWAILIMVTIEPGRRFAPFWVNFVMYGGAFAIIYVWTTGWKDNTKEDSEKKDIFKM
jgi:type IV secretory pathway component VirB8